MGLQHRRTGDGLYWQPEFASTIYFVQNDTGFAHWPPTDAVVEELLAEFNPPCQSALGSAVFTPTLSHCIKAG